MRKFLISIAANLERRQQLKERQLEQIDSIEQQYEEVLKDYAGIVSALFKLRHRKEQIRKQLDNMRAAWEAEKDGTD